MVVRNRELALLTLVAVGDRCALRRHQEPGADDRVRATDDRVRQVRDVVRLGVRLERKGVYPEHGLGAVQALELRLVERLVVESADIADERGQKCPLLRSRGACTGKSGYRNDRGDRHCKRSNGGSAYFHVPSLRVSLPPLIGRLI